MGWWKANIHYERIDTFPIIYNFQVFKCLQIWQVCDIEIPEVQDKLKSFTESKNYDSKNGWLTESFLDKIREAIDKQVLAYVNNTEEGLYR